MSDKAEAAYHQWLGAYIAEHKGNVDADMLCHSQAAFFDGYTAASADTERLVREAVMATIEEAKLAAMRWGGYRNVEDLNVSAIVRRVMASEETANVTEQ